MALSEITVFTWLDFKQWRAKVEVKLYGHTELEEYMIEQIEQAVYCADSLAYGREYTAKILERIKK